MYCGSLIILFLIAHHHQQLKWMLSMLLFSFNYLIYSRFYCCFAQYYLHEVGPDDVIQNDYKRLVTPLMEDHRPPTNIIHRL